MDPTLMSEGIRSQLDTHFPNSKTVEKGGFSGLAFRFTRQGVWPSTSE